MNEPQKVENPVGFKYDYVLSAAHFTRVLALCAVVSLSDFQPKENIHHN